MLAGIDFYVGPSKEIAIVGRPDAFLEVLRSHYRPRTIVAAGEAASVALLQDRPMIDGKPTAYVCENFTCRQPVTDVATFETQL